MLHPETIIMQHLHNCPINMKINNIFRILFILVLAVIIFNLLDYLNYKSTTLFYSAAIVLVICSATIFYLLYKIFKNKINQP